MTSNVSSDSSSLSPPAWDPLQAPYSKGRTKTRGWKRQPRLGLSRVVKKSGRKVEVPFTHPSLYSGFLVLLSISCSCEVVLEKIFHSSHAASPSTRKIGSPGGTPLRGGVGEGSGRYVGRECWSRANTPRRLLPTPRGLSGRGNPTTSAHAQRGST